MSNWTRRDFLAGAAAIAGATVLPRFAGATDDPYGGFKMGAQSYSFRKFSFEDSLAELKKLGLDRMEFCSVHFPPAAGHDNFPHVKKTIEDAGVNVVCFGVEGFTDDHDANRVKFEFAKALDIGVLTADPTPKSFDSLDKLTEEFGIKIAIHNHGPNARYNTVEDTLRAVKDHSPMIGGCVDTGHVIRSAEKPHEVITALGDRVISLHLKDWVHGGDEQILGNGDMDLVEVAKALKALNFDGPLNLEFELDSENPVPGMKAGLENWSKAIAAI